VVLPAVMTPMAPSQARRPLAHLRRRAQRRLPQVVRLQRLLPLLPVLPVPQRLALQVLPRVLVPDLRWVRVLPLVRRVPLAPEPRVVARALPPALAAQACVAVPEPAARPRVRIRRSN